MLMVDDAAILLDALFFRERPARAVLVFLLLLLLLDGGGGDDDGAIATEGRGYETVLLLTRAARSIGRSRRRNKSAAPSAFERASNGPI